MDLSALSPTFGQTLVLLGVWGFGIGTLSCTVLYFGASYVNNRCGRLALLNPVFVSVSLLSLLLFFGKYDVVEFQDSSGFLLTLLPICVSALAMPMYRRRGEIVRYAKPLFVGVIGTTLFSGITVFAIGLVTHGDKPSFVGTLLPKSITGPVAQDIAAAMQVNFALAGAIAISTGICGAVFGPMILRHLAPHHHELGGIAIGSTSHGIATAQLFAENYKVAGTFSGLAMAVSALCGAFLLPLLWWVLLFWF